MADEVEFICDLLQQHWGEDSDLSAFPVAVYPHEINAENSTLPCLCVTFDKTEYIQHGFAGTYLSYKKYLSILIFSRTRKEGGSWEDEVVRIMKHYCKVPTTTQFPTAIIDYIHIDSVDSVNDYLTSPQTFVRRIMIVCDRQRNAGA